MFVLIADTVKSTPPPDASIDDWVGSQRGLIFDIISFGLPVALMNGLEFRDSKVSISPTDFALTSLLRSRL